MPDDKNKPQQTPPPTEKPSEPRTHDFGMPPPKEEPKENPLQHNDSFIKKAPPTKEDK